MKTKNSPHRTQKRFPTAWNELAYLCQKLHHWLHERRSKTGAKRYLDRLQKNLHELPANEFAILRAEALALLHEVKGDTPAAIKYRQREIELMKRLQRSVHESVAAGEYNDEMARSILRTRDDKALKVRQRILNRLERQAQQSTPNGLANGQARNGPGGRLFLCEPSRVSAGSDWAISPR